MNATTDLLYPTLINLVRTFNSRGYRMEIEKLPVEELESYIDKLTECSIESDMNRNEKLRICLRFRNAYLIQLPFFSITKSIEDENPFSHVINKLNYIFYYLNFKNDNDIKLFKATTANTATDKYITAIFILKENSFGYAEMKQYARKFGRYGNFILEIKSIQYNHLVSRYRFQEMLFTLSSEPFLIPCADVNDVIFTLQKGRNYLAGRYPENIDNPACNITSMVKSILSKINLAGKGDLVWILLIEKNPDLTKNVLPGADNDLEDLEFFKSFGSNTFGAYGYGFLGVMLNTEMNCETRVSLLVTEEIQTGKTVLEIERDRIIAHIKRKIHKH